MSEKIETFSVRAPDANNKGKWIEIGKAWPRRDGGFNLKINSVPVGNWDGGAVVLPPLKQDEAQA
jgi:hypothetical protein